MKSTFVWISIYLIFITKNGIRCQPENGLSDDVIQLKAMLRTSLQQNKKMEQQNNRLKLIWTGMQQMCSALSLSPINNHKLHETKSTDPLSKKNESTLENVNILSIKSDGLVDETVVITINYTAPESMVGYMVMSWENGGYITMVGDTRQTTTDIGSVVSNKFVVEHFTNVSYLVFNLENSAARVDVVFNESSLIEKGEHNVSVENIKHAFKLNDSYTVPLNGDLNINISLSAMSRSEVDQLMRSAQLSFTGLNVSAQPAAVFIIEKFNEDNLGMSVTGNETNKVMTILLRHHYVKYGGMLLLRLPQAHKQTGYIRSYMEGYYVSIFSGTNGQIVPYGSIGLSPLPEQTLVHAPGQAIFCSALGNPKPTVSILKLSSSGKQKKLKSSTLFSDGSGELKTFNLMTSNMKSESEKYICRANNGNNTIEMLTEAVLAIPVTFDEKKTGVMKNTTTKIVISCKASGRPLPRLEMRLMSKHGPDISKSDLYKVIRRSNDMTTKLIVTISPVDERIHKVFCTAVDKDRYGITERIINIYTDHDKQPGDDDFNVDYDTDYELMEEWRNRTKIN